MYQSFEAPRGESSVSVIGAGVAGAWQALGFARAGHAVTLYERGDAAMAQATSYWAGGMLAPWCEREASEPLITRLGTRSLNLWREEFPEMPFDGSLVLAHPRDRRARAVASGAADPSALAALYHSARQQSVHDRRHLDRARR